MKWNTEEFKNYLSKFGEVEVTEGYPGEHFTDEVSIMFKHNCLTLGGFDDDGELDDPSNDDIQYLFLCDNSGDGLKTRDKEMREIYFEIKDHFEDEGYTVVDNYEDYF